MKTQFTFGLPFLVFFVTALLLAGCKGGGATKPQPVVAVVTERLPTKPAYTPQSTQPARVAIGTQMGGSRQGIPLVLKNVVSTFSGRVATAGATDSGAGRASFDSPKGITTDGVSLFLADLNNHTIRKIDISSGTVTTVAGVAGKKGSSDGKGAAARFNRPYGITTDGTNLYVTDSNNHCIRQIEIESGMVSTLAGGVGEVGYVDGKGMQARFFIPEGITTDGANLYVSDTHNHSIRKIDLERETVSTIAGLSGAPGFADDVSANARFSYPKGITTDGRNLYVIDFGNHRIRKVVIASGLVTTIGGGTVSAEDSAVEEGESARFNYPTGITTDGRSLYVVDTFNRSVRKLTVSGGAVYTIAGKADLEGAIDGIGSDARFKDPVGITTDGAHLYVTDSGNNTVRKIR